MSGVDTPELLSLREAACRLNVSPQTIRRRIATGELRALRLGGSDRFPLRVAALELDALLHPIGKKGEAS